MAVDKPQIPEEIEEVFKHLDGQMFILYALLARVLQRLEKHDGESPESFFLALRTWFKQPRHRPGGRMIGALAVLI